MPRRVFALKSARSAAIWWSRFNQQDVAGGDQPVGFDEVLDEVGVEPHVALRHLDGLAEDDAVAAQALLYLRQHAVEAGDIGELRRGGLWRRKEQDDGDQGYP